MSLDEQMEIIKKQFDDILDKINNINGSLRKTKSEMVQEIKSELSKKDNG
jgi:prefoldin subunit 5